jgi:hypothetical protein
MEQGPRSTNNRDWTGAAHRGCLSQRWNMRRSGRGCLRVTKEVAVYTQGMLGRGRGSVARIRYGHRSSTARIGWELASH